MVPPGALEAFGGSGPGMLGAVFSWAWGVSARPVSTACCHFTRSGESGEGNWGPHRPTTCLRGGNLPAPWKDPTEPGIWCSSQFCLLTSVPSLLQPPVHMSCLTYLACLPRNHAFTHLAIHPSMTSATHQLPFSSIHSFPHSPTPVSFHSIYPIINHWCTHSFHLSLI